MKSTLRLSEEELVPFKTIIKMAVKELIERGVDPTLWRLHWMTGLEPEEIHRAIHFDLSLVDGVTMAQHDRLDLLKPFEKPKQRRTG
jgi:hypothetical protein